jgi:glyoxylase-like metal-dependent hydrolase (beta-lactamase superfamily II)
VIFKPYYYFEAGCAAYLFGCGGLGKCAVVDAQERDMSDYIAFASAKGMRITHVIDTHVHADHRSAGPALAARVGAAYCLHESAEVGLPFEPLRDGQLLAAIGDVAHPSWRASSVGVYRLWRDLGYAIGAVIAGVTADAPGVTAAMGLVARSRSAPGSSLRCE